MRNYWEKPLSPSRPFKNIRVYTHTHTHACRFHIIITRTCSSCSVTHTNTRAAAALHNLYFASSKHNFQHGCRFISDQARQRVHTNSFSHFLVRSVRFRSYIIKCETPHTVTESRHIHNRTENKRYKWEREGICDENTTQLQPQFQSIYTAPHTRYT